jgi:uncharacterized protein (DUF2062 family)
MAGRHSQSRSPVTLSNRIAPLPGRRDRQRSARLALMLRWRWRQLRRKVLWIWSQEGSPSTLARGLAAGVFTGCLPFFGLQIVLGVALASAMRGNRLLAAAGTWISNPLTTLPICWLNYQLGVVLLGPGPAFPGMAELDAQTLSRLGWSFTSRLMLGSLLIGGVAAAVCGVVCWQWLHRRERRQGRSLG